MGNRTLSWGCSMRVSMWWEEPTNGVKGRRMRQPRWPRMQPGAGTAAARPAVVSASCSVRSRARGAARRRGYRRRGWSPLRSRMALFSLPSALGERRRSRGLCGTSSSRAAAVASFREARAGESRWCTTRQLQAGAAGAGKEGGAGFPPLPARRKGQVGRHRGTAHDTLHAAAARPAAAAQSTAWHPAPLRGQPSTAGMYPQPPLAAAPCTPPTKPPPPPPAPAGAAPPPTPPRPTCGDHCADGLGADVPRWVATAPRGLRRHQRKGGLQQVARAAALRLRRAADLQPGRGGAGGAAWRHPEACNVGVAGGALANTAVGTRPWVVRQGVQSAPLPAQLLACACLLLPACSRLLLAMVHSREQKKTQRSLQHKRASPRPGPTCMSASLRCSAMSRARPASCASWSSPMRFTAGGRGMGVWGGWGGWGGKQACRRFTAGPEGRWGGASRSACTSLQAEGQGGWGAKQVSSLHT